MNQTWLLRMMRWARNPPSARRVAIMLGVVAASLALAGIEKIWGWPEALTVERVNRP
jgi:hypothetical protein